MQTVRVRVSFWNDCVLPYVSICFHWDHVVSFRSSMVAASIHYEAVGQVWWKPLPNASAAAVLYASRGAATISFRLEEMQWQGKQALVREQQCLCTRSSTTPSA